MVVLRGTNSELGKPAVTLAGPDTPVAREVEPDVEAASPGPPALTRPRVTSPLDAAFKRPPVTQRVTELFERRTLSEHGPCLVAYGRFDPEARPVVLVHGIRGSGEEMLPLADRLVASGRQVYLFQYDDTGEFTSVNGQHLARALRNLAAQTAHTDRPLDIVAHSMGGIVTRVAMNTLEQDGVPGAGFRSVRVQTLDTPLDGHAHEAPWFAWTNSAARSAMQMLGLSGYYDMRGSSAMFASLYATDLTNVTFRNTATTGKNDVTRLAHDFDEHDRSAIASYLTGGPLPDRPRARNYARALEHDARGPRLREHLRAIQNTLPPDRALLVAYETVMPHFLGTHTWPLENEDFLDGVVHEVNTPDVPEP